MITSASNEIGTIQNIKEIAAVVKERGIPFHTDAVQTAGVESSLMSLLFESHRVVVAGLQQRAKNRNGQEQG